MNTAINQTWEGTFILAEDQRVTPIHQLDPMLSNAVVFKHIKRNLSWTISTGDMPWIGNETLNCDMQTMNHSLTCKLWTHLDEPTHSRVRWGQQTPTTGSQDASDTFRPPAELELQKAKMSVMFNYIWGGISLNLRKDSYLNHIKSSLFKPSLRYWVKLFIGSLDANRIAGKKPWQNSYKHFY